MANAHDLLMAQRASMMGGKPTALDYIGAKEAHDGQPSPLIAMWDGIENAGYGVHDPNATVWLDLVGGVELVPINTARLGEKSLVSTTKDKNTATAAPVAALQFPRTVETVFQRGAGARGTMVVFGSGDQKENPSRLVHSTEGGVVRGMASINSMPVVNIKIGAANTVAFVYSAAAYSTTIPAAYLNGAASAGRGYDTWWLKSERIGIGAYENTNYGFLGEVFAVRLYNRTLTPAEIAANYAIDKARFGLT